MAPENPTLLNLGCKIQTQPEQELAGLTLLLAWLCFGNEVGALNSDLNLDLEFRSKGLGWAPSLVKKSIKRDEKIIVET